MRAIPLLIAMSCAAPLLIPAPVALAQVSAPSRADMDARRATARLLTRSITVELNEARLADIVQFIGDYSGVEIEPFWSEDGRDGLDKEQRITVSVKDATVLTLLERVLARARTDFFPATWQFAPVGGAVEIGPRSALNRQAYLRMYDVQDLLFQIPNFDNAPQLDLDQALNQGGQGGGGGGGGGNIFGQEGGGAVDFVPEDDLARRLIDIITENVETEQWQDNGGDGGTIRYYAGSLLVRAPDYIHRQLLGYPFDLGKPAPRPARRPSSAHHAE